jgi:hypothetical protein
MVIGATSGLHPASTTELFLPCFGSVSTSRLCDQTVRRIQLPLSLRINRVGSLGPTPGNGATWAQGRVHRRVRFLPPLPWPALWSFHWGAFPRDDDERGRAGLSTSTQLTHDLTEQIPERKQCRTKARARDIGVMAIREFLHRYE